jgi:hypothetical protein
MRVNADRPPHPIAFLNLPHSRAHTRRIQRLDWNLPNRQPANDVVEDRFVAEDAFARLKAIIRQGELIAGSR